MGLFASRGPATAARGDDGGRDRRFPDPPRHHDRAQDSSSKKTTLVIRDGDDGGRDRRFPDPPRHHDRAQDSSTTTLVISDALLTKIERAMGIILAEQLVTKIERAMALRANEPTLPKKTPPSSVKWSCDICQVGAPTEGHLQQHFAGQKHRSRVVALVSTAVTSENVRQYDEKSGLFWVCRYCQSNCTCKSHLEDHLRGKRHKAKIQSLLEECKNMAVNCGSLNSQPNLVTQDEDNNPALTWNCSLCQAKCSRQSDLANHLRGKRHQLNFLVLQVEGKQYLTEWGCGICHAKCNSVSQFENHCSSWRHKQKVEALRKGGQIAIFSED